MPYKILDTIDSPADLKGLSYEELDQLAFELRAQMIATTSRCGGHLAPSLGAVEIIIALHRVLDCPKDKLVFDVGHQAYAHKLLTGRKDQFETLRTYGGISGFPKITESEYDSHDSGHASDSLSTALGYAYARDLDGSDAKVAALIGDASFTGGMALEGLNNIGHSHTNMVIVLNDNGMSISPNVGGFASYLAKARMSDAYTTMRDSVEEAFNTRGGRLGRALMDAGNSVKESFKSLVLPGSKFLEGFGLTYIGPVDGHDISTLEDILRDAVEMKGPVVVHAVTTKGKGYAPAERHPNAFHGVGPFDIETGKIASKGGDPSWTSVFGDELVKLDAKHPEIVAITAAMADGTGLKKFSEAYPKRFCDVGIAEEHAVTMASSLALSGKVPFVAIYSTFLQRAFDQIMINVGLQRAHVVFCLDRAGLVGADGPTHHGAFDLTYMRAVPGMKIMVPANDLELRQAMNYALELEGPVCIRYSRGSAPVATKQPPAWELGRGVKLKGGADAAILAVGRVVPVALEASDKLAELGLDVGVFNMRWAKPLDAELVQEAAKTGHIFTLEDNSVVGGFGSGVLETLSELGELARVTRIGLPDDFVTQGSVADLDKALGLDAAGVAATIGKALGR